MEERHHGMTGSQQGMTRPQSEAVERMLTKLLERAVVDRVEPWLDHGDCIGSDAQVHRIAERLGFSIAIRPPRNSKKRAFCKLMGDRERTGPIRVHEEKDYLDRNRDIVDASVVLLATPKALEEEQFSGTWSTVRYARKIRRPQILVFPNGLIRTVRYDAAVAA